MSRPLEEVLVKPGDAVTFRDRDDLLKKLDDMSAPIPARHEGRTKHHREHACLVGYLRFLAGAGDQVIPLPATVRRPPEGFDPPDFVIEGPDQRRETFEITDGSTEKYQRALSDASRDVDRLVLPVDINTSTRDAAELWSEVLFSAFLRKTEALNEGRLNIDHLLIYDLTGLGLLLPLHLGAPILRRKIEHWTAQARPRHRFPRVSVLRDLALLFDVTGRMEILDQESSRFRLPVIRADNEEDLRRRLREMDRFCRDNRIRHLKAFGSILGDREDLRDQSDLDLLVEFEPGTRVTLMDMARMQRELTDLTGFRVDLRTAEDLSRYFRGAVVREAVELRAAGT